ncbi:hypothetical protein VZT92_010296 [Zoarces viviparus]|uniref:AIG1-type G domain-containing protein n=1 Tax=Zoarces viviparus TaxID=48416 RepID=A0AAW1FFF9_ZOAVI
MSSKGDPPPYAPKKFIVALFGKRVQLKNAIGKMILHSDSAFNEVSNNVVVETNERFKVVNTPDFFNDDCLNLDQIIIDFMAHSLPGPDLFILAIDSENSQEEKVKAQVIKLQETFGENITAHLLIMLQDIEHYFSLKQRFGNRLVVAGEYVEKVCLNCCSDTPSFQYDFRNYSEDVVMRRKATFEKTRHAGHSPYHHGREGNRAWGASDDIFNIVLLGLTGTGKSASANTILTAGNSNSRDLFKSEASSIPITTQCVVKEVEKPFGTRVRLVDTPDFFNNEVKDSQAQVDECKKYCQPGQCAVLLVLQAGRFTGSEKEIVQRLEDKLGWKIRDSTIVLLTHKDDLKESPPGFINAHDDLRSIVQQCGGRYHLFNNNSKKSKQVLELIEKIPHFKNIHSMFVKNKDAGCCVL